MLAPSWKAELVIFIVAPPAANEAIAVSSMAKDVDATLRKIVQEQGGKSVEQANEYVEKLKSEKRYKRDVY